MLTQLEKQLLNNYQQGMPLVAEPYAEIARELNTQGFSVTEQDVISCLASLQKRGMVSRVGAVIKPHRVGTSTLAAIAVPEGRMNEVAQLVNSFEQVNHNYEREHRFNLWFVVTGSSQTMVDQVLDSIKQQTGLAVLDLPMEADYHIDLGFPLFC
jgi:DNA-binding Lrp family transcriptional regulator